jgi:catechol 2,3-dioxygenase-like lactoylglutathione lyase family enzyme
MIPFTDWTGVKALKYQKTTAHQTECGNVAPRMYSTSTTEGSLRAVRFRVARPTTNLERLRAFYVGGLGLLERGSFQDHAGYNGLILGTANEGYEIEFTTNGSENPCPPPGKDHLLVFYLSNRARVNAVEQRLRALGALPVQPENPYWQGRALTFEDPDGWRVVVVDHEAVLRS